MPGEIVAGVEDENLLIFVERKLEITFRLEIGSALERDADLLAALEFDLLLASAHAQHQRENQDGNGQDGERPDDPPGPGRKTRNLVS